MLVITTTMLYRWWDDGMHLRMIVVEPGRDTIHDLFLG